MIELSVDWFKTLEAINESPVKLQKTTGSWAILFISSIEKAFNNESLCFSSKKYFGEFE